MRGPREPDAVAFATGHRVRGAVEYWGACCDTTTTNLRTGAFTSACRPGPGGTAAGAE